EQWVPGDAVGGVSSVNDKTGVVNLTAADVGAEPAGAVQAHVEAADPHGDRNYADTAVGTHSSVTSTVHGIANTADLVLDNDSRLSDARPPTSHASQHGADGADPIGVDAA